MLTNKSYIQPTDKAVLSVGLRYGAASTLITSRLPAGKWRDVIGGPAFAGAILGRPVHNSRRLEPGGPSMRKIRSGKGEKTA